jgi:hypothetical protein
MKDKACPLDLFFPPSSPLQLLYLALIAGPFLPFCPLPTIAPWLSAQRTARFISPEMPLDPTPSSFSLLPLD